VKSGNRANPSVPDAKARLTNINEKIPLSQMMSPARGKHVQDLLYVPPPDATPAAERDPYEPSPNARFRKGLEPENRRLLIGDRGS
jgi:hypothetical protein